MLLHVQSNLFRSARRLGDQRRARGAQLRSRLGADDRQAPETIVDSGETRLYRDRDFEVRTRELGHPRRAMGTVGGNSFVII
jgi:hypothetical protein